MTEQEFRNLIANDLVRIVTTDRKFHLVTTHASMCSHDAEQGVMIGWVRCWCVVKARWLSIDPAAVYAHEALNHFANEPIALG